MMLLNDAKGYGFLSLLTPVIILLFLSGFEMVASQFKMQMGCSEFTTLIYLCSLFESMHPTNLPAYNFSSVEHLISYNIPHGFG